MEIPAKLSCSMRESLSFQHTYILVPKQEFMECQNLAVAHSIYTVQPQQTTITVRVLNPSLEATTVHLNQKIGQLNPLAHVGEVCYLQPQKSKLDEIRQLEANCSLPPSERLVLRNLFTIVI